MATIKSWYHPNWIIQRTNRGYKVTSNMGWVWVGKSYPTIASLLNATQSLHSITNLKTQHNGTESNN